MIVAEFNRQHFVLASVEDAETLMGVLSRGRVVEEDHRLPYDRRYIEGSTYNDTLSVHVTASKIVTRDEAKQIKQEIAEAKKRAEAKEQAEA